MLEHSLLYHTTEKTEVGTLNSSRPTVIALSIFTLRLVENWRSMLDAIMSEPADVDTVLIMVAVAAVGGEKFKRGGLEDELQSLSVAMPEGRLTNCNVSSIAAATGMNRETARRKVAKLEQIGMLQREGGGGLRVNPAVAMKPEVQDMIRYQLRAVSCLTDQLSVIARSSTG